MEEKAAQTRSDACEEYCPFSLAFKAARQVHSGLKRCLPEEFWQHRAAARREGLLALRSLVDAALAHSTPAPARKATRIKVE